MHRRCNPNHILLIPINNFKYLDMYFIYYSNILDSINFDTFRLFHCFLYIWINVYLSFMPYFIFYFYPIYVTVKTIKTKIVWCIFLKNMPPKKYRVSFWKFIWDESILNFSASIYFKSKIVSVEIYAKENIKFIWTLSQNRIVNKLYKYCDTKMSKS